MPYRRTWIFDGSLREMDRGLTKESTAELSKADLQKSCFMQDINPVGLKRIEAEEYLDKWPRISLELKGEYLISGLSAPNDEPCFVVLHLGPIVLNFAAIMECVSRFDADTWDRFFGSSETCQGYLTFSSRVSIGLLVRRTCTGEVTDSRLENRKKTDNE